MVLAKISKISGFQRWLLCLCASAGSAGAQEALEPAPAPAPSFSTQTPSPQFSSSHSVLSSPLAAPQDALLNGNPFRWGIVNLHPHLLYRFSYGDGIQARPGQSEATILQEFSPGILATVGDRWSLDYTPTFSFYSSSEFRDTVGHNVVLAGSATYESWLFGLSQIYNFSSDPLVETGTQTDQENYLTALTASYHLNETMWVDLGLNQAFRLTDDFSDSREWSTMDWLNWQLLPGLDAAIGAGFGYVDAESSFDMTYEQVQGRIAWHPGEKLSLTVNGGVEYRQFLDSNADSIWNPIFGATIDYQVFEQTRLSLRGNRRISASYFNNEITETTDVALGLNQRLLGRLFLDLGYGFSTTEYVSSATSASTGRDDDTSFFDARLGCTVLQRGSAAAFFRWSENSSSQSGFDYSSTQVGFELGYRY